MPLHNPPHAGSILLEDVIKPLNLTITAAAKALGITRKTLSRITNESGALTPEMAVRLELAFKKPSAEQWLRLQNAYDLWQTRQHSDEFGVKEVA